MTTIPSTAVVVYDPDLVDPEHVAPAGFLAGYRGITRDAYALDLRKFVAFCTRRDLGLFEVRRSDIGTFARELEAQVVRRPPWPDGCVARRPSHDCALRPGESLPRPSRHVHRVHLHRWNGPLTRRYGRQQTPAGAQSQCSATTHTAESVHGSSWRP